LFYLPVPLGIGVSIIRLAKGRRNPARPLETLDAISVAVAGIRLFIVFPFNFARLADLLPSPVWFLFLWIPNYLGRIIVLIAGLGDSSTSSTRQQSTSLSAGNTPDAPLPQASRRRRLPDECNSEPWKADEWEHRVV
jgi:hypothetical protein